MKICYAAFLAIAFFAPTLLSAQNKIVGFSPSSAQYSGGLIWEANTDGSGLRTLHNFDMPMLGKAQQGFLTGNDGLLYGITAGQVGDSAAVFFVRYSPVENQVKVLHTVLSGSAGSFFINLFIKGADGSFYFIHPALQKLFKVSPDGATLKVVASLAGNLAIDNLIALSDGRFAAYSYNHPSGYLNMISIFPANWGPKKVIKVVNPVSEGTCNKVLVQGADGYLYGCTSIGSKQRFFKIKPDGSSFAFFKEVEGHNFQAMLLIDDGNFLLTDVTGIYCLNPTDSTFKTLYEPPSGSQIAQRISQPINGYLYFYEYNAGDSFVQRISTNGSSFSTVVEYSTAEWHYYPTSTFAMGPDGYVYGWPPQRRNFYSNTNNIFRFQNNGGGYQEVLKLTLWPGGGVPQALFKSRDGKQCFGYASYGGANGNGFVFKMMLDGTGFQPIYQPPPANTTYWTKPDALIEGSDGFLYLAFVNKIYRIAPDGSEAKVIAANYLGGKSLMEASDGRLYWMEYLRYVRMAKDGSGKTVVANFTSPADGYPGSALGPVIQTANGDLVGQMEYWIESGCEYYSTTFFIWSNLDGSKTDAMFLPNLGHMHYGVLHTDGFLYGLNNGSKEMYKISIQEKKLTPTSGDQCLQTSWSWIDNPLISGSDGLIYAETRQDRHSISAWNPVTETCQTVAAASPALGFSPVPAFFLSSTTPTLEPLASVQWDLSPNPVQSMLSVSITSEMEQSSGPFHWQMISATGAVVVRGESSSATWSVPMEHLPAGVYFFQVKNGARATLSRAVLKG